MPRSRVAVLISGRGSNMSALVKAAADPDYPAEIALVFSNDPDAAGLKNAGAEGIATESVSHQPFGHDRQAHEAELNKILKAHRIELVCLAGYMRLLSPWFVGEWHNRMINIHPSLLPAYKGLNTHQRALDDGVRWHGCSVHFVRAEMDEGPIIAQAVVPVMPDDTEEALSKRVLESEHRLYPHALEMVASGQVSIKAEQVTDHMLPALPGSIIHPAE